MATFTHQFGFSNVTSSINYYLVNNLGVNLPSWMSWNYGVSQPRPLNFSYPDQPLSFPSFSVTHHTSDPFKVAQGDRADGVYRGVTRQGQMEINCWVLELLLDKNGQPAGKNNQWRMQLYTMRDMVFKLFETTRFIQIYDFAVPTAPTLLNAIIKIRDMREAAVMPDPNPAVKRIRTLCTYTWVERYS